MLSSLRATRRVLVVAEQRRGLASSSNWFLSQTKSHVGVSCPAVTICGTTTNLSNNYNVYTSFPPRSFFSTLSSALFRPVALAHSWDESVPSSLTFATHSHPYRTFSNESSISSPNDGIVGDVHQPNQSNNPTANAIVEPPIRNSRSPVRANQYNNIKSKQYRRLPTRKRIPFASGSNTSSRNSNNNNNTAPVDTFLGGEESSSFGTCPVQAFHAAHKIDLAAVVSKVFAQSGIRKMMERLSVVIQLPATTPVARTPQQQSPQTPQQPAPPLPSSGPSRFVVVFRFGAVVFFNVPPREAADLLHKIKQHSREPVLSGVERKENFCVHIQPDYDPLEEQLHSGEGGDPPTKVVTGEYCVVQELNMKSVDVISNILAQSVALDAYNDTVDDLLANFSYINGTVKGRGSLTAIQRDSLFRTVAQNNSIFIEMVSKLGIKDRSTTAWNLSQYVDIHAGMQEEFEINLRFEHIEFKLDLIQQNAKFFLEVLQSQKSNSLEWIIIILILFECVLMCMEMSGLGGPILKSIGATLGHFTGDESSGAATTMTTTTTTIAGLPPVDPATTTAITHRMK
jgi:uncharacterized Rmd1/YagE family protein